MCQCIYCDEPITGEAGINYGGYRMHVACYVKFNDEMEADLGEPDEDDMEAWLSVIRGAEGFEDDHVEVDLVGV